jgi:hypothetical protein
MTRADGGTGPTTSAGRTGTELEEYLALFDRHQANPDTC